MSNPLKENLESILLDFEDKAREALPNDCMETWEQLYFIRLIVAVCVCKFNIIPSLGALCGNKEIIDSLGFSFPEKMLGALSGRGRIPKSSARKAAKILGISFSFKRFIKYRKDPESTNFKWWKKDPKSNFLCLLDDLPIDTNLVIETFIEEGRRKAGKITPELENQIYFRKLLIEAYVFKFNSAPRKFSQTRRAEAFGFKSPHTLYHHLRNLKKTIELETAEIAAEILGKEFQPPHPSELKELLKLG